MGCISSRDNEKNIDEHAKWTYINLEDFHSTSSLTFVSYVWVWIYAGIGVGVFALDTFTAVELLALDKWSSEIQPAIKFEIAKWIFVGCYGVSCGLYIFEWVRAIIVMRRNGVAESYMDPLGVQVQCMRPKGWRRFLVFAALTKSKKGKDYVAFFVYFQFRHFFRIVLAEGGRQFVNAVTIVSVAKADLVPTDDSGSSAVLQFFKNIVDLWDTSKKEALVLGSMCVTLSIWVISALSFIIALILYCVFLWHQIPQEDGRLTIYCKRKIDRRLSKIVEKKVQAAIEEQDRKRAQEEAKVERQALKAAKKNGTVVTVQPVRQPTLPSLDSYDDEKKVGFGLERMDTMSTLPPYTSGPATRAASPSPFREPALPDIQPPPLLRHATSMSSMSSASNRDYSQNASLLGNATAMGYDNTLESPVFGSNPMDRPGAGRNMSNGSMNSQGSYSNNYSNNYNNNRGPMQRPPLRTGTGLSSMHDARDPLSRAGSALSNAPNFGPPRRTNTGESFGTPQAPSRTMTGNSFSSNAGPQQQLQRQPSRQSFARPFGSQDRPSFNSNPSTSSSIPESSSTRPGLPQSHNSGVSNASGASGGYLAFNPNRARTPVSPLSATSANSAPPEQGNMRRNMTNPMEMQTLQQQQGRVPQRSVTAPVEPWRAGPQTGGQDYPQRSRY